MVARVTPRRVDADDSTHASSEFDGIWPRSRPPRGDDALDSGQSAAALLDTLIRRFPAVSRLAGPEAFRAAATSYVQGEARKASFHAEFGENFCDYLDDCREAAGLPWLPDLARLEWLRWSAWRAPDCPSLTGKNLCAVPAQLAPALLIEPHPSLGIIASNYPVVSVWESHGADAESRRASLRRGSEEAMIVRVGRSVRVLRTPPGAYQFIDKVRKGATVAVALDAAAEWNPQFDMEHTLKWFSWSGAIAGFRLAGKCSSGP